MVVSADCCMLAPKLPVSRLRFAGTRTLVHRWAGCLACPPPARCRGQRRTDTFLGTLLLLPPRSIGIAQSCDSLRHRLAALRGLAPKGRLFLHFHLLRGVYNRVKYHLVQTLRSQDLRRSAELLLLRYG